ncbi:MAG TPA: sigma-54 dependent transcriptional regulator, partial [Gammaproteobacteria bacterium]
VIVSDIRMPDLDGLEFLQRALAIDGGLPVILVTGHGDINMAVTAIRDGAYDFLEKPFAPEHLADVVKRALEKRALTLENRALRRELENFQGPGTQLVGNTRSMHRLRALIAQIADTDADVLVLGETGTGKELVARSLHEQSRRHTRNFVAVNCGALPESMIESELFGLEAGAFTGAQKRRIGKFEHANGGTLFLDEIETMPLPLQIRLLRVLQERAVERLGSNELIPLDLRVVAATKVDLQAASAAGEFREDLFYRLNVVTMRIPALRERRDDIALLFQHFALLAATRYRREVASTTPLQMQQLMAHDWPGNVRELRNCAERFVLLGECSPTHEADESAEGSCAGLTLPEQVDGFERSLIVQALARHKGSIKDALESLGLPRKTLYDKMRKYGLDRHQYMD